MLRHSLGAAMPMARRPSAVRPNAHGTVCWPRRCLHRLAASRGGSDGARPRSEYTVRHQQQRRKHGVQTPQRRRSRTHSPPQPEPFSTLVNDLEAWAVTAPAGCTVTSGKVARALSCVRAGERTAYLQRAAELGHANAGVALEFLRLVFTDPECEWQRGAALEWSSGIVKVLSTAGLEMRVQPLLWVLSHCAKAGADSGRACVILSIAQAGGVTADVHLYSALVNVAAKQRHGANFALALRVVENMRSLGVTPNEVTHNSLFDALGRQRQLRRRPLRWDSPVQRATSASPAAVFLETCDALMKRMVQLDGVKPSARTLTGLTFAIGRLEGGADIQPAFATLDFLRHQNIPSDRVFYTSLIHACAAARGGADLDSAQSILFMMESDGLQPDLHTYNELLAACAWAKGGGRPAQAEAVLTRIDREGLTPDIRSYNLLLEAYARRPSGEGDAEIAMEVLQRIEMAGVQPTEKTFELLMAAVLRSARNGTGDTVSHMNGPKKSQRVRAWLRGIVGSADRDSSGDTSPCRHASELSVESRWRYVLEAMESMMDRRSNPHTGGATRSLLNTLAQQGQAEHILPVLEEMANNRGKGGVLGGKLGPSALAVVIEACARAAEQRRPLHASLRVWPPPRGVSETRRHGDGEHIIGSQVHKRNSTDLANHAQLAIRIAEAAAYDRRYGHAATRLSPVSLQWLVVACLHDTATAAQKMLSSAESSPLGVRHVQYATLSRGIALVESLQRRLPKQWSSHHEEKRPPTTNSTVGAGGSYAERLRWAVRTLNLLNSLCGSGSDGRALASILQDNDKTEQSCNDDDFRDGSAPASVLLAALIRSCTQSQLSIDGDVTLRMSEAAYTAAVAVNNDAAKAPDVFTAMIEAHAHVPQQDTQNQLAVRSGSHGAQRAFHNLDTMRSMHVSPTLATFNALLSVCTTYRDKNLALSTYDMMHYHRIQPDHTTFVHLIRACDADATAARQIYDEHFAVTGLPPSAGVFEVLAQAHAAAGELDNAVATLQELEQTPGLLCTDACYDAVLLGAAASVMDTSATAMQQCPVSYEEAQRTQNRAVTVAVDTLDCMHHEGRRPGAVAVISLLHALEGVPLDIVRWLYSLHLSFSSKKPSDARQVAAAQRRRVLEAVQRWDGDSPERQLQWDARTPPERREQQHEFRSVCRRLWHPL